MIRSYIICCTITIKGPKVSVSRSIVRSLAQKKKATAATRKSKLNDSSFMLSSMA